MDSYIKILKPIIKNKPLVAIMGLCLGGEIGLQLAYYLDKYNLAHPKVYVIDGMADRGNLDNFIYVKEPGVSDEINQMRNNITRYLIESFTFKLYRGETHICLAGEFITDFYENIDDNQKQTEAYQIALRKFESRGDCWKKQMPHCVVHYLHANHMNISFEGPSLEMKQIVDSTLFN